MKLPSSFCHSSPTLHIPTSHSFSPFLFLPLHPTLCMSHYLNISFSSPLAICLFLHLCVTTSTICLSHSPLSIYPSTTPISVSPFPTLRATFSHSLHTVITNLPISLTLLQLSLCIALLFLHLLALSYIVLNTPLKPLQIQFFKSSFSSYPMSQPRTSPLLVSLGIRLSHSHFFPSRPPTISVSFNNSVSPSSSFPSRSITVSISLPILWLSLFLVTSPLLSFSILFIATTLSSYILNRSLTFFLHFLDFTPSLSSPHLPRRFSSHNIPISPFHSSSLSLCLRISSPSLSSSFKLSVSPSPFHIRILYSYKLTLYCCWL